MTIGNRINTSRLKAGLTADDLGTRIGKNRATIYRYESDDIDIPLSIIKSIADVLNVSPGYLMGWTDDPGQYTAYEPYSPPAPPRPRGARILSSCAEVMKPDELDRAIGMMKIMFPQYNDILERKEDDNEP